MMVGPFSLIAVITVVLQQVNSLSFGVPDIVDNALNVRRHESSPRISHQHICQKAVREIASDTANRKRDDVFVNLVVNVCFPGVDEASVLLQLIETLSGETGLPVPQNTQAPWDAGLLPEVFEGQEGLEGVDEDENKNKEDEPEFIGGLPAETGPGQEGIDTGTGGNGGEEMDTLPDSPTWWDGGFADTETADDIDTDDEEEPPASWKKDRTLLELFSFVFGDLLDNYSGSSSSSSEEEPIMPTTTKSPTPNPPTAAPTREVTTKSPTTKVTTDNQTTKLQTTEAPIVETTTIPITTVALITDPLPSVNPNKKNTQENAMSDLVLELLLRKLLNEFDSKK